MTTLYWVEWHDDTRTETVHIEFEGDVQDPQVKAALGGLDGVRGGPENDRGVYVPLRPEHAAELRERASVETA